MKNEAVAKGVKTVGAGLSKGFASLTKAFSQLGDTVKDATNEYQTPAARAAPAAAPAEAPAPAPAEEQAFEGFDAEPAAPEPAAPEPAEEKKPAAAPAAPDEAAAASG